MILFSLNNLAEFWWHFLWDRTMCLVLSTRCIVGIVITSYATSRAARCVRSYHNQCGHWSHNSGGCKHPIYGVIVLKWCRSTSKSYMTPFTKPIIPEINMAKAYNRLRTIGLEFRLLQVGLNGTKRWLKLLFPLYKRSSAQLRWRTADNK